MPNALLQAYPALCTTLQQLIDRGTIHHVTAIQAPTSEDCAVVIRHLARLLLCDRPGGQRCSDQWCPSCLAVLSDRHPDIYLIAPVESARTVSVDQARQLRAHLQITPEAGQYRIGIIPSLDDCTPATSNALLKVLEEPHPHAMIIGGTTDLNALPATLRSRLHCLMMAPLTATQAAAVLTVAEIELPDARERIQASGGSLSRLLDLCQPASPAWTAYQAWMSWWDQFLSGDSSARYQLVVDRFGSKAPDRATLTEGLTMGLQHSRQQPASHLDALPRLAQLLDALNANVAPSVILDGLILHL